MFVAYVNIATCWHLGVRFGADIPVEEQSISYIENA